MTTPELCESAAVSQYQLQLWLETGLIEAETVGIPEGGRRFEFGHGQLERVRLLKQLRQKHVPLGQLAAGGLAFDDQAYLIFDGDKLRACRDATAAIGAVVKAKCWCSGIDLASIRTAGAE